MIPAIITIAESLSGPRLAWTPRILMFELNSGNIACSRKDDRGIWQNGCIVLAIDDTADFANIGSSTNFDIGNEMTRI
jgi:hypothetical protein